MRYILASTIAALAFGAALGAAAPAEAQQQPASGTAKVYYALSHSDLETLLNNQDFKEVNQTEPGVFTVTLQNGFKMRFEQRVCDVEGEPSGCLGLSIMAAWGFSPEQRPTLIELANTFNGEYAIGKVMLFDTTIAMERYIITDGGVTLQHIETEINEFRGLSDTLIDAMVEALGL